MNRQVSPAQAIIAIIVAVGVIGGIWWFANGRGPAPANQQEVERMLQQNPSPAPPGEAVK